MKYYKIEVLDNFLKQHKISKTEFCKMCGISMKTLKKFYADKGNIKLKSLIKILTVMQVRPTQFLTF